MSLVGHSPPPIFHRGLAPRIRLLILSAISIVMLVADLRFGYLEIVRQVATVAVHPLQRAAAAPVDFARNAAVYFATLVDVQLENAELRRNQVESAQRLLRFEQLEYENAQLRQLAGLSQAFALRGVGA
jgi:rod shape-determining protein MreC